MIVLTLIGYVYFCSSFVNSLVVMKNWHFSTSDQNRLLTKIFVYTQDNWERPDNYFPDEKAYQDPLFFIFFGTRTLMATELNMPIHL